MADTKPTPALCKVTIYEIAERSWGLLSTSAEVDDRIYVGSAEWRRRQRDMSSPPKTASFAAEPQPIERVPLRES
jgi:hypothetical protein